MTAYMYFSTAKRAGIKDANPDASFGDIARLVSDEWKKLDDSGKAEWAEKAKKDKLRYEKEMKDYTPPSDDDDSDGETDKKPKAKRAKKDPNAPKRPMNAYMLYSNSVRAKVREENPELSITDVSKEIGARYKKLGADEKAKLKAKVDSAMEVYKKEMAAYETSKPKEEKKQKAKAVESKKKKKKKPEPEPESSDSDDSDDSDGLDDSDSESDSD